MGHEHLQAGPRDPDVALRVAEARNGSEWTDESVLRLVQDERRRATDLARDVFRLERNELLWNMQNDRVRKLRRLKDEPAMNVFGAANLWDAFAPLHGEIKDARGNVVMPADTLYVGCPDDRCGAEINGRTIHRFAIPGSGVLQPFTDAAQFQTQLLWYYQDQGVQVVPTYHDNCGACAYQAKKLGKDPVELAKEVAGTLGSFLGNPQPTRMGYDDGSEEVARLKAEGKFVAMRGVPDYHDARVMVVDLSNRCYSSGRIGFRPSMKLNRYHEDPAVLIADVELLLSIMMDPHHAPGYERFKRDPYLVSVIGMSETENENHATHKLRHPEFEATGFAGLLEESIRKNTPFADAVEIVAFEAPSPEDCSAWQEKQWKERGRISRG